jgi:hypothetical protein
MIQINTRISIRYAVYTYPCVNLDCFISPTILMYNHNRDFLCFNFYQQGFSPNSENSEYLHLAVIQ